MIARQIVIKGDDRSETYAEMSRKSFERALDDGVITEIVQFDAITPNSPDFEEHCNRYVWQPSLMTMDTGDRDHSPTEKAGMCSHWELMRQASETDDQFWVMEHDTYLIPQHYDTFRALVRFTRANGVLYSNIGLYMGMYSLERITAAYMYELLTKKKMPINCGPYCTLQRAYRTYTTDNLRHNNHRDRLHPAIHPWHGCNTLAFGRNIGEYYNYSDPAPNDKDTGNNFINTPTTQIISKSLSVTQDHHTYSERHKEQPWTRHHYFHVVD